MRLSHSLCFALILLILSQASIFAQEDSVSSQSIRYDHASVAFNEGKFDSAIVLFDLLASRYAEEKKWDSMFIAKMNIAFAHNNNKQAELGQQQIDQLEQEAIELLGEEHGILGHIYQKQARLYLYDKEVEEIKKLLDKSMANLLAFYGENSLDVFAAYQEYASICIYLNLNQEGNEAAKKALEMSQTNEFDRRNLPGIYGLLAFSYDRLNLLRESLTAKRKQVELSKKFMPKHSVQVANTLAQLGELYTKSRLYDSAEYYFLESIEIMEHHQEMGAALAPIYNGYGALLRMRGDFPQALHYHQQSRDLFIQSSQRVSPMYISVLMNISVVHRRFEEYEEARKTLDEAIEIVETYFPPNYAGLSQLYMVRASLAMLEADYPLAISQYKEALAVSNTIQPVNQSNNADILLEIAVVYAKQKNYHLAKQYYLKSLAIFEQFEDQYNESVIPLYTNLGKLEKKQNNWDAALGYLQKGMFLLDSTVNIHDYSTNIHPDYILNDEHVGALFWEKNNVYYLRYLQSNEEAYLRESWRGLSILLDFYDFTQSRRTEPASLLAFMARSTMRYPLALAVLKDLYTLTDSSHYLEQAFALAEKSHAASLYRAFSTSVAEVTSDIPQEHLKQRDHLMEQMNHIQNQISDLEARNNPDDSISVVSLRNELFHTRETYKKWMDSMEESYPGFYQIKYDQHNTPISWIQHKLLHPSQALVEYFVGDTTVHIFCISPSQTHWYRESFHYEDLEKIDTLIQTIIQTAYPSPDPDSVFLSNRSFEELSYEFYQQLIEPIEQDLMNIESLIIVPDVYINYLPFECLLTHPSTQEVNTQSYLIHRYDISYAYSAKLLEGIQEYQFQKNATKGFLAFCPQFSPNYGSVKVHHKSREGFYPLAFTEKEVNGISDLIGGQVLLGNSANKQTFIETAPKHRFLHLATHAKVYDDNSNRSGIVFSSPDSSGPSHSTLTIEEIYSMHVPAEMVVLSACETGLGELESGEGIMSLGHAFTFAGTHSIISTLWSVNDQSTSELMISFYRYLDQGMSKDGALRQAKLDYLDSHDAQFSHPFYWAAPIAIGDMSPVDLRSDSPIWLWRLSILGLICVLMGYLFWRRRQKIA